MTCTREQVRILMRYAKTKTVQVSAAKAGMALETARKYLRSGGNMPEKQPRCLWQTKSDPLGQEWQPKIEPLANQRIGSA
jgi:hypothetical protein